MTQTEHYGLNLWDLSDRIKMEDFNGDNQKIDTALAALAAAGGGVKMIRSTVSSGIVFNSGCYILKTADPLAWDEFSVVIIMGNITEVQDEGTPYFFLGPRSSSNFYDKDVAKFNFQPGGYLCLLTPMKDHTRNMEGLFLGGGNIQSFWLDKTFGEMPFCFVGCEKGIIDSALCKNSYQRILGLR